MLKIREISKIFDIPENTLKGWNTKSTPERKKLILFLSFLKKDEIEDTLKKNPQQSLLKVAEIFNIYEGTLRNWANKRPKLYNFLIRYPLDKAEKKMKAIEELLN